MGLMTLRDVWPGVERATSWSPPAEGQPLQPKPERCPKTHKIRYPRKVEALCALEALRFDSPHEDLAVYVCKSCFSWHVGHLQ
jgi:hypothetical protein